MKGTSYVGLRQWAALLVADNAYPLAVSGEMLTSAIKDATTHRSSQGVIASLLGERMLAHACANDEHREGAGCLFRITEAGAGARLNRRGRTSVLAAL